MKPAFPILQSPSNLAAIAARTSPIRSGTGVAFHQDYKRRDRDDTAASSLIKAAKIGRQAGLRYVYAGNLPGHVGGYENTYCPSCQTLLIERYGYTILKNVLQEGACPTCHVPIPGVWD